MLIKGQFTVLGAKKFKGDVEGTHYDSTKVHVVMDVSEKNGSEVGQNAQTLPFGKSDEFDALKGLTYPCQCDLEVNVTTRGLEVVALRPIKSAPIVPGLGAIPAKV